MPQPVIAEIGAARGIVGAVTLGAITRIAAYACVYANWRNGHTGIA